MPIEPKLPGVAMIAVVPEWDRVMDAAASVRPPDEWRAAIARPLYDLGAALYVVVSTCPLDRGDLPTPTAYPPQFLPLAEQSARGIVPRLISAGADWREAVRHFGPVHSARRAYMHLPPGPAELAATERLGIRDFLTAILVTSRGQLAGYISLALPCVADELMETWSAPLHRLSQLAGDTLSRCLALAGSLNPEGRDLPDPLEGLTRREREIAALVTQGLSDLNIAANLGISESTVATHLTRIFRKLGLHSRVQLVVRASRRGVA